MSLPDMDDRPVIDIDAQAYLRILLEAQRRRKSPNETVDELVNEALDRVLGELRGLGKHHTLSPIEPPPPRDDLASVTRAHILRVLIACEGNISAAALRLGVDRNTLQRKMKRLYVDIEPISPSPEPRPTPSPPVPVEICPHGNVAGACRSEVCVDVAVTPSLPSRRPMCDVRRDQRCVNPLYWRGTARCGCPRPSRSAA